MVKNCILLMSWLLKYNRNNTSNCIKSNLIKNICLYAMQYKTKIISKKSYSDTHNFTQNHSLYY